MTIDGKPFDAELWEDISPKTITALEQSLPLEGKITHAAWGGDAMFIAFEGKQIKGKFEPESQTIYGANGELFWYIGDEGIQELFVAYGQAQFSYIAGDLPANAFGRVNDQKGLQEMASRLKTEGSKKARIEIT